MSQERLAQDAGISCEHLNHIENYRAAPSLLVTARIARGLGFERLSAFLSTDPLHHL
ncbi:MAG TPA: helix-turn-helix transcriptional regulator [Thermoanaerobaculia bacterium]|nr:helix-turn-helix transcriptional regulator [Thermoanaerobaculia bacterium]